MPKYAPRERIMDRVECETEVADFGNDFGGNEDI
jgi:hypothetical protein